jgi:hypothetical protein
MNAVLARKQKFAHGRKCTRPNECKRELVTKRLAALFLFLCTSASVVVAQTYDPPASPVVPTSQTQCDKFAQEWSQVSNHIEAAHQKCLEAHQASSTISGSAASGSSSTASGAQGYAPSASSAPRQTFVAFSFCTLGLHSFGGDGAWGIATNNDEQKAINQSGINCASNSQAPDWCGAANGGRYEVCKSDGKTRYVALATNNDGQSID